MSLVVNAVIIQTNFADSINFPGHVDTAIGEKYPAVIHTESHVRPAPMFRQGIGVIAESQIEKQPNYSKGDR